MKRFFLLVIFLCLMGVWMGPAWSHNPFTTRPKKQQVVPEPPIKSRFFVKIIDWQHLLKQKMSQLIRASRAGARIAPLLLLMGLAFAYGAVHATGPGHGKIVATSYVLSHNATILGGVLFGLCIAMVHGVTGAVGVLGLRYLIQKGVGETLGSVTAVTQMVSFALIALLGLGILIKNGYAFFFTPLSEHETPLAAESKKKVLPWALAVGLVPCPAVVMVMLFCLSMGVMTLGLLLAVCISLGMAVTLSMVVSAVVMGKAGILNAVSQKRAAKIEGVVGILSGTAITFFGTLFLLTTIRSAFSY